MTRRLCAIVCGLWLAGCGMPETPQTKMFRENLGKRLDLQAIADLPLLYADSVQTFGELIKQSRFLSLIYVDELCDVCQVKLVEWNRYADLLPRSPGLVYVILFRGNDFETFRKTCLHGDPLSDKFVVAEDPQKRFVIGNAGIPYELLDHTVLIDSSARMLLFGEPFATPEMTRLYRQVVTDSLRSENRY